MKKRSSKTPFILRLVQWAFPIMEKWTPFFSDRLFRLVFYIPLKYPLPEKEREVEKEGKKFTLQVGGRTIRGHRWGDVTKPYILLVHGWAGRATQFRKFIMPFVDAGFQVIGPDGPAHGRSDGIKSSIQQFEQMFHALFNKFGHPAGIITHSFGGAAVLYAFMNGLPVTKLVNIASPSIGDEILKTYLRAVNASWISAERFKQFVLRKTGKSFDEFTACHTVTNLPHPIQLMVVNDEDDKEVTILHAEELMRVYPSASLLRTSGLGHSRVLKDERVILGALEFISG